MEVGDCVVGRGQGVMAQIPRAHPSELFSIGLPDRMRADEGDLRSS